jgi:hypothetical protein
MTSAKVLGGVPAGLREPLLEVFAEIGRNYFERRWEPSELNGGKFCEVVYTIAHGALTGKFAAKPAKPPNLPKACEDLANLTVGAGLVGARSLRILIPRMLPPLYEIRNNRGVGHVGGEVDPNFMDATAVFQMAGWVMAELVRIFHNVSTDDAQSIVNGLVEFKHPLVWENGSVRRVLDPAMSKANQTLVLLYGLSSGSTEQDLVRWVEHSNPTVYRRDILRALHKQRKIEYDADTRTVRITPLGTKDVEDRLLGAIVP